MPEIAVLVVDDHPLMREAISAAIDMEADMTVIGEATNGIQAVEQARALRPDVIIMDLLLPGMDGLQTIAAIREEFPDAHILALTSSQEEGKVLAAVQAGALGYLLKDVQRRELIQAIRQIDQGEPYLPPHVALHLLHSVRRPEAAPAPAATSSPVWLTPRQQEVFDLLGRGLSDRQIADRLVISEATVRSHIYHILGKLRLETRSQAIAYAAQRAASGSSGGAGGD